MPTLTLEQIKRTLIVFVKSPIPGEVKTRLIPYLTGLEAADLYKCFVTDILRQISHVRYPLKVQVAYQPHSKASDLSWVGAKSRPEIFKQEGRSLGERLIHSFGLAFGRGSQHVVIIGSDSPNLPVDFINQAYTALEESDVVLGPSKDGGYYLLGLSRPCLKLFDDVSWSSDQIFERTAYNAQTHGYKLRILPTHYDIDTIDDLHVLHQELLANDEQAPMTRKFLHALTKSKPLFSQT